MTGLLETYGQGTYGSELYGGTATTGPAFVVEVERMPGVWEDVTCDVRTISMDRGRSKQLDSFSAASASVVFADESDRYNAWNPVGIWSGSGLFRTDLGLRVRIVQGFSTFALFTGTTDDVVDSWPGAGADAQTEVRCTDAMKLLARARPAITGAVGAGELPGVRVGRILDAIAYAGPRNLEPGTIAMAATTLDGTAIDLCDEAREVEWGSLYIDRDGVVRFRARDSIVTDPRQATVQWTFDDMDIQGPCYSDLKLIATDEAVYNRASITRAGGATQVATIADSLGWYGPRTYTRANMPISADTGALTLAQTIVAQHAYNERRVDEITFYPLLDPALLAIALDVRMLDRVRVIRRTGVVIDAELQVQAIHHTITGGGDGLPGTWECRLETTNARSVRDAGQWDVGQWDVAKWSV